MSDVVDPHSPEARAKRRTWRGYVGTDNIEHLADRVRVIFEPGRRFTAVVQRGIDRGDTTPEVTTNLTLADRPGMMRSPIEVGGSQYGRWISILFDDGRRSGQYNLSRFDGFGLSCDRIYWTKKPGGGIDITDNRAMTEADVRATIADGHERFDYCHVVIHGGLSEEGPQPTDEIVLERVNEHGYRERIIVVPDYLPEHTRIDWDATAIERMAEHLAAAGLAEAATMAYRYAAASRYAWQPIPPVADVDKPGELRESWREMVADMPDEYVETGGRSLPR